MGTPDFAVPSLKMLIDEGYDIPAVLTRKDKPKGRGNKVSFTPIKEVALENDIEVLQPENMKDEGLLEKLKSYNPDLFVTAAYGKILTKDILDIPKYGCINVHGSLLPEYRGAAPIHRAIIDGKDKTGITTMFTDVGLDTGDILLKKEIEITDDMTVGILHDKMANLGAVTLKETLELLKEGKLEREKQDDSKATYAALITKEDGHICWQDSARDIYNRVRGTNPWPGAYTSYDGQRVKIFKASILEDTYPNAGQIMKVDKNIYVATGDGTLAIEELQFENSKRMATEAYLLGHKIEEGKVLI